MSKEKKWERIEIQFDDGSYLQFGSGEVEHMLKAQIVLDEIAPAVRIARSICDITFGD